MAPELSFGVELEFILIFHEDEIVPILRARNPSAYLEKSLDPKGDIAQALRHKAYGRLDHNSWAVVGDGECPDSLEQHVRISKDGQDLAVRCYHREVSELVQQIIYPVDGFQTATVHYEPVFGKHYDYTNWTICGDPSLPGLSSKDLVGQLGDRSSTDAEASNWDSWGVEIVSPVFRLADVDEMRPSMARMIKTLAGTPQTKHRATVTEHCGLHVHIGFHDNSDFPLETIQNLALLVTVYEHEILRLCGAGRTTLPGKNDPYELSNRENLFWACDDIPYDRPYVDDDGIVHSQCEWEFTYIQKIKDFLLKNSPTESYDNAAARIVGKLCLTRQKFVNFTYLLTTHLRPQTIEFRQHEGTADPTEICWWVQFCGGLVDLAGRIGRGEAQFRVNRWEDTIWYADLLEDMNFPAAGRWYFLDKLRSRGDDGAARDTMSLYSFAAPASFWAENGLLAEDEPVEDEPAEETVG